MFLSFGSARFIPRFFLLDQIQRIRNSCEICNCKFDNVTPDNLQQSIAATWQDIAGMFPVWLRVFFFVEIVAITMTAICLPVGIYLLWRILQNIEAKNLSESFPQNLRLQQIRDRREAKRQAVASIHDKDDKQMTSESSDFSATHEAEQESLDDDSRFQPPS
jgi:hypothetical protein